MRKKKIEIVLEECTCGSKLIHVGKNSLECPHCKHNLPKITTAWLDSRYVRRYKKFYKEIWKVIDKTLSSDKSIDELASSYFMIRGILGDIRDDLKGSLSVEDAGDGCKEDYNEDEEFQGDFGDNIRYFSSKDSMYR